MPAQTDPSPSERRTATPVVVRRSTLIITNLIKLAGLVFAVREMLTHRDPVVMATAIVMMSGAQGLETVAVEFFGRFFGTRE